MRTRRSDAEVHVARAEKLFEKTKRAVGYSVAWNDHLKRQQAVLSNMERLRSLRRAQAASPKPAQSGFID